MTDMKLAAIFRNHCLIAVFIFALLKSHSLSEEVNNNDNVDIFHTKSGSIRGVQVKINENKTVNVFYGIPYSEPPVGQLRFKPPVKVQPWRTTLEATKPKPPCYQQLPKEKVVLKAMRRFVLRPWYENCLNLNIWAPALGAETNPVIVYIHGGGYVLGSGTRLTDGTTMASEGFVVVTINYRLGVFGFFSLGNKEAPGNLGLMDQNLALQWVNDNVEVFGGDPDSITVVGMSAGSASVGFHLLSLQSSSLFKRAVLMSGVPTNWWATKDRQFIARKSQQIITALGCQSENSSASLFCLQQRHPEDIIELCRTQKNFDAENNFGPIVDGEFVTEDPTISLDSGRVNKADVMIGSVIDEGALFMLKRNEDIFRTEDARLYRRDFWQVIERIKPSLSEIQTLTLGILYSNASNPNDPIMLRDAAKNAYSDSWFICGIDEFADKLAKTENAVYRYIFDYKLRNWHKWGPRWAGAIHGQDKGPLLTPLSFLKQAGVSDKEIEVSKRFRKHIQNFARNGDPNVNLDEYPGETVWPKFDKRKLALNFASTSTVLQVQRQRECAAWLNLVPKLEKTSCQNINEEG